MVTRKSFRFVACVCVCACACARLGGKVGMERKLHCRTFPFPFWMAGLSLFSCEFPSRHNLLSNFSWLYLYSGVVGGFACVGCEENDCLCFHCYVYLAHVRKRGTGAQISHTFARVSRTDDVLSFDQRGSRFQFLASGSLAQMCASRNARKLFARHVVLQKVVNQTLVSSTVATRLEVWPSPVKVIKTKDPDYAEVDKLNVKKKKIKPKPKVCVAGHGSCLAQHRSRTQAL